jgi:hypothetical protein
MNLSLYYLGQICIALTIVADAVTALATIGKEAQK